jgi:small-conductance mechanosensitive channel
MSVIDRLADAYESLVTRPIPWDVVGKWAVALVVFLIALLALRILKRLLTRYGRARAEKWRSPWALAVAELPDRTRLWFLIILAAYLGSLALGLEARLRDVVMVVALVVQGAIWASALLDHLVSQSVQRRIEKDAAVATTVSMLGFLGKLVLWSLAALLVLQNAGVNVTALVAGLGIGGVAIALAAQNILGDLFASLSIVLDKPFVLGDFIVVDQHMGMVEHIGVKTTRLRSLSGEQLVFSNSDLLKSRISNHKRMKERRVVFTVGVTHQTPLEKLSAIPAALREIVQAQERVRLDRAHFKSLGDSALIFEVVYYVLDADYNLYMDVQQAINFALVEHFHRQGIELAYPTQTIYVEKAQASARE